MITAIETAKGISSIDDYLPYAEAMALQAKLNRDRKALEKRDDEISDILRQIPHGTHSIDAEAAALLHGGPAPDDPAVLRQEQIRLERDLQVVRRAIETHHNTVRDQRGRAERLVREYHAPTQREFAEAIRSKVVEVLELLVQHNDWVDDIGVPFGGPWITVNHPTFGCPPDFERVTTYVNELEQELKG